MDAKRFAEADAEREAAGRRRDVEQQARKGVLRGVDVPALRGDPDAVRPGTISVAAFQRLQRLAGNRAVGGLLRAPRPESAERGSGSGLLHRAGDLEGLMKEHHKSGFTYHHVIPENKLHSLWKTLSDHDHLPRVQAGLKSVTTRGLAQFDESALSNIKLDLTKEIQEIVGPRTADDNPPWDESKFKEVVAAGKSGGTSEALAKKFFPGLEEPSHKYNSSYRPIIDIFNKRFKLMGQTTESAITATVGAEGDGYLGDKNAAAGVQQILMWMPGNIHRGPNKRFTPKDKGAFDKDLDDGGDEFEEGAKNVIGADQFQTLSALNAAIDTYLKMPDETDILATIASLLDKMKSYSVKDFDEAEWEEVTAGPPKARKTAWRLKKK